MLESSVLWVVTNSRNIFRLPLIRRSLSGFCVRIGAAGAAADTSTSRGAVVDVRTNSQPCDTTTFWNRRSNGGSIPIRLHGYSLLQERWGLNHHKTTIPYSHPQIRMMATRKNKAPRVRRGHLGLPPLEKTVDNVVTLQMCHCENDLVIEPDDLFFTKAKFALGDIKDKCEEIFETSDTMEYFEEATWKPLRTLKDIEKYKGGKIPLKIRIPDCYDDTPLPPGYLNDIVSDEEEDNGYIGDTIKGLVAALKVSGYTRSNIKQFTVENAHHDILTRDWLLERAEHDQKLKSILLGYVGALDHIVEFLHVDFVWK
jgi:hypothetical protein